MRKCNDCGAIFNEDDLMIYCEDGHCQGVCPHCGGDGHGDYDIDMMYDMMKEDRLFGKMKGE